jgi:hypothetical protein
MIANVPRIELHLMDLFMGILVFAGETAVVGASKTVS